MPVGATIGALGSVAAAGIGYAGATSAAKTQADAATQAENLQLQMFNTAQAEQQPYNTVGQGAINTLSGLYGINGTGAGSGTPTAASLQQFTQSPDYAFAQQQGDQALQRSAAAGGTLISGGQLKAAQEFGQGLASQQYGNYYNRLLSLAQIGQSAASGVSNAAITTGANAGNSIQAAGQATASGIVGGANALSGGLTGASSAIGTSLLASKLGIGNNSSLSSYAANNGLSNSVSNGGFNYLDAAAA